MENKRNEQRITHIAYRCPECLDTVVGIVGRFALSADMLRLRCPCGKSAADISVTRDGKVRLSVPCLLCGKNHDFTVSAPLFFERDLFRLNCPYADADICFIGEKEKIDGALDESADALARLAAEYGAESVKDLAPRDMDDDEILPAPEIYDMVRFLVKELEADGEIDCPCHSGEYDFRFTDGGVQVFCPACGASYTFAADSAEGVRESLTLDHLTLS